MKLICFGLLACLAIPALGDNLVQLATKLGAKTLVEFVTEAGLADTLANGGPFTVFGPTDDAFNKLPSKVVKMLKEDKKLLADVLKFHVLNGKVFSSQLSNELTAPSLNPLAKVRINIYQGGKVITATGSPVVLPDQNATNGVIHVIDRVMFPLPLVSVTGMVGMDPKLSTLLTAVKAADLVQTLSGDGPFTLFAPTNEAFQKLPAGVLANLLKNKTALADVLTYHVVSGTFYSAGLTNGMSATTVEGKPVTITISGGKVMVGKSTVEKADDAVSNGVVHIIDTVLIPPALRSTILP
ncbi:protein sll1483-like [Mytilus californianus]|uniref:protein sll1483-like n=1 Tax=Mytilus californianus TaxID=6549 RepID=UPI0022476E94|nr:protein sll1483-like [Mytilus californianus]